MGPKPKTRQSGRSTAVLQVLTSNRNQELHIADIAADTGLTEAQVSGAVSNLKRTTKIETPRKGWYVYRGPASNGHTAVTVKAKAEVVSILADGQVLLNIEGQLYVAQELEIS